MFDFISHPPSAKEQTCLPIETEAGMSINATAVGTEGRASDNVIAMDRHLTVSLP